jgi:hypothetical protein
MTSIVDVTAAALYMNFFKKWVFPTAEAITAIVTMTLMGVALNAVIPSMAFEIVLNIAALGILACLGDDRLTEHRLTEHPGPRSYRPDLVGRWPRPGSRRTVPVPSHCRQSSTLIPMRSSAGQSAVALRGTHMVASRS